LRLNISTTVQTVAKGQIPRSTERILVYDCSSLFFVLQNITDPITDSHCKYNADINIKPKIIDLAV